MIENRPNPKTIHPRQPTPLTKTTMTKITKEKLRPSTRKNRKAKILKMTFEWPKTPKNEDAEIKHAEQTLQLATQADIVNKRITIPVILEIKPLHGRSNLNIALAHRNIFIAIKRPIQH